MDRFKVLSRICIVLAILLSNIMCVVVSYEYCTLEWCGKYGLCSAPPSAAFLYIIPFVAGIIFCIVLAWIFCKKISGREMESRRFVDLK